MARPLCANCKAEVGDDAIDGLCPRCLLRLALEPSAAALDERFGPYRTIRVLGEGGMGIVYLAEQEAPIRRLVALKVIKLGMDTEEVLVRFESERQALAMMDHPSIAHVYDAGATAEGRPYFAMEYVEGVPITRYCDGSRLTLRERIGLFIQVCNAVQHAHQKGIIHRDLKPSNVLVRRSAGLAIPTIIDFGLAKALGQHLTGHTLYTQLGALMGTPEYMSPEQAGAQAVDTRTDVYALGLLLYELLAGAPPFDSRKFCRAAMDEMLRAIRLEEPPSPAHRLASLGAAAGTIAESRRMDVHSLERQLRGELKWIAFKALEKEPARRYASVSELAADLTRYLHDEPVSAGPQGAAYRLCKLIRRHRTAVATMASVAVCLVTATIVALSLYFRAESARAAADRHQYQAALNAAALQIRMGEPDEARQELLACPQSLRGWEWRHLLYRTDPTVRVWKATVPMAGSPDADLVTTGDGRVLWRTSSVIEEWVAGGRHLRKITGLGDVLALDPTGLLAAARDSCGRISITAIHTGSSLALLDTAQRLIRTAAFDPNGERLALGSDDGWLQLWRISPPKLLFEVPAHNGRIACIRFVGPRTGAIGTAGSDQRVRVWDAATGRAIATISEKAIAPWVIAFAHRPNWMAFVAQEGIVPAQDLRVRVYDVDSGRLLRSYPCPSGVTAIAFTHNPLRAPLGLAFVSAGGDLQLCSEAYGCTPLKRRTNDRLSSVTFSPDATLLYTGSESGEVAVWSAMTTTGTTLDVPSGTPRSFAMHPSGKWALGSIGSDVEVWGTTNGGVAECWRGHTAEVNAVAVSAPGSFRRGGRLELAQRFFTGTGGWSEFGLTPPLTTVIVSESRPVGLECGHGAFPPLVLRCSSGGAPSPHNAASASAFLLS